jgi:hypothetical protein
MLEALEGLVEASLLACDGFVGLLKEPAPGIDELL